MQVRDVHVRAFLKTKKITCQSQGSPSQGASKLLNACHPKSPQQSCAWTCKKRGKGNAWQCAIAFAAPLLHLIEQGLKIVGVEATAVEPETRNEIAFALAFGCVCHGFSGGN